MKTATIDGVEVHADFDATLTELENYVEFVTLRVDDVCKIFVRLIDDDTVTIDYTAHHQKFERIRRITGYLVGTIDRWNDAKQAEEKDRVKHE